MGYILISYKSLLEQIIWVMAAYVIGVVCHEYAHARVAFGLGDTTAKDRKLMTLNPFTHISWRDLLCTFFTGYLGGKQSIPYNPDRMNVPIRKATILVNSAGVLTNLALAIIAYIIYAIIQYINPDWIMYNAILFTLFQVNTILIIVNLIPLPPTDGFKLLCTLLPVSWMNRLLNINIKGVYLSYLVIIPGIIYYGTPFIMLDTFAKPIQNIIQVIVDSIIKWIT